MSTLFLLWHSSIHQKHPTTSVSCQGKSPCYRQHWKVLRLLAEGFLPLQFWFSAQIQPFTLPQTCLGTVCLEQSQTMEIMRKIWTTSLNALLKSNLIYLYQVLSLYGEQYQIIELQNKYISKSILRKLTPFLIKSPHAQALVF